MTTLTNAQLAEIEARASAATPGKWTASQYQRATSILDFDYTNLCKSFEDAMSGNIYEDDDQVRFHGPGAAIDTTADFACAHVWQGGPWKPEWTDFTIPPVEGADD